MPTPAAEEYNRALLDPIWRQVGYLPAHLCADKTVIGMSTEEYKKAELGVDAKPGPHPRLDVVKPLSPCICGGLHEIDINVYHCLALGSGYLTLEEIDNLDIRRNDQHTSRAERSHLCGVAWCQNPIHRITESRSLELSRGYCFEREGSCEHPELCLRNERRQNNNIDALVKKAIDLRIRHDQNTAALFVPIKCDNCNEELFSIDDYIDHAVVQHQTAEADVLLDGRTFLPRGGVNLSCADPCKVDTMNQYPDDNYGESVDGAKALENVGRYLDLLTV